MDHEKEEIINPNSEQKYGFQIIQPIAGNRFDQPAVNQNQAEKIENIILTEAGELKKIFRRKSITNISIWLYASHLRIDDSTNKQILDDIPTLKIKRVRAIWYRAGIKVKIKGKRYRIVWGNTEGINFFQKKINFLRFVFKGDPRSKLWVTTIKKLKKQTKIQVKTEKKQKKLELKQTGFSKNRQ